MEVYWILEYGKVFCGYIFLMFIWPSVVFRKHLKDKTKTYWFSFCVTVQIVVVNSIILLLGIFHILSGWIVICLFYGIFFTAAGKTAGITKWRSMLSGNKRKKFEGFKGIKNSALVEIMESIYSRAGEYISLSICIIFGMVYFSYGAFQMRTYAFYDVFLHHEWINGLVEGQGFSGGGYPEGMHCFVYCLHVLSGIKIYSILSFLQCIHVAVFLLSAYLLLREIFYWRYSAVFTLILFLTLDFSFTYGMSRLQATMPMEFGLHAQFLCALYLMRYLKYEKRFVWRGKNTKFCWNENLLLFMMSLSVSLITHFYVTIMAFILCASVAIFKIRNILKRKNLIPLIVFTVCGCVFAVLPMAGAYVSGIPLEGSIYWGLNSIKAENNISADTTENIEGEEKTGEASGQILQDLEMIEKLPDTGQKAARIFIMTEYLLREIYRKGYQGMYSEERGRLIVKITAVVIGCCLIARGGKWQFCDKLKKVCSEYPAVILLSFVAVAVYAVYTTPELGLMVLIPDHRFCSAGHMFVLAVMVMPADIIFSMSESSYSDKSLQRISYVVMSGIYVFINILGVYHAYLYFTVLRYDAAARVTNSIISEFPKDSYTVISPREEKAVVALDGDHKDIWEFLVDCADTPVSIPTKYVFIYVEKKPIEYYQKFFLAGPSWLGKSGEAKINAYEISEEAARKDISDFGSWYRYGQGRIILESKAYAWCQYFAEKYPSVMDIYYEDENFVCYYFEQDAAKPYDLGMQIE